MPNGAVNGSEMLEKPWPSHGPFSLDDGPAYAAWRAAKLSRYPTRLEDLVVEVGDLGAPTAGERQAVLRRARLANMALYVTNLADESATRHGLIAFAEAFGLVAVEDHRSAEADGIVRIELVDEGGRFGYIPYTDKPINWHTDGYYNYHGAGHAIRAMLLHCLRPAVEGGVNRLLDPEIAYIRLRDSDPGLIEALMHPAAMTIPVSVEANGRVRPENRGPVFDVDPRSGALGMRFTARTRNVVWRDDPATRRAVDRLVAVLRDDPLILKTRMEAGQGLICNNVLHDRTAFARSSDPGRGRLLYRVRYDDRIDGWGDPLPGL